MVRRNSDQLLFLIWLISLIATMGSLFFQKYLNMNLVNCAGYKGF